MDTLYYSNYCKHCQRVLQYLTKGNLANKLNFVCIDKRSRDVNNNQIYITLENGQKIIMPPNIHSVPALLLVKQNYRVILGDDIMMHFQPAVHKESQRQILQQREPVGTALMASNNGMNILSEQYTLYNLTHEELSAKGNSERRPLYNYVSVNDDFITIPTPPDDYQPDKIQSNVTVDLLQQKRIDEVNRG
jgi:glutaredoxin-related protein